MPIFVQTFDLDSLVENRPFPRVQEVLKSLPVRFPVGLGNDQIGKLLIYHLIRLPPKNGLCLRIPPFDDPVGIHRHQTVQRSVDDHSRLGLTRDQRLFCSLCRRHITRIHVDVGLTLDGRGSECEHAVQTEPVSIADLIDEPNVWTSGSPTSSRHLSLSVSACVFEYRTLPSDAIRSTGFRFSSGNLARSRICSSCRLLSVTSRQ